MKKKIVSLLLLSALLATNIFVIPAIADSPAINTSTISSSSTASTEEHARQLESIHILAGTSDGYQLESQATRLQGLVMMVRLLGAEQEAFNVEHEHPFIDLTWGTAYVGYAYEHGYTKGTSSTTFSPDAPLSADAYITFLLRALGYTDTKQSNLFTLATEINLITERAAKALPGKLLSRGDMVDIAYAAMSCKPKESNLTLAQKLVEDEVFSWSEGAEAKVLSGGTGYVFDTVFVTQDEEPPDNTPSEEPNPAPTPIQTSPTNNNSTHESDTGPESKSEPEPEPEPIKVDNTTVSHEVKSISTSQGTVSVHVITANSLNSRVSVKAALAGTKVGNLSSFSDAVQTSGAKVAINANFFLSGNSFKAPIGHVISDGQVYYASSGLYTLAITNEGKPVIGRTSVVAKLKTDYTTWTAYEVNVAAQTSSSSVIYTPNIGTTVTILVSGHVMTVKGSTIIGYQAVSAGTKLSIPSDGYIVFMGSKYTQTSFFVAPKPKTDIEFEWGITDPDSNEIKAGNIVTMIAGAPCLVKDSSIVTELPANFNSGLFVSGATARTAIGVNKEHKLVIVSAASASMQQMREIMLAVGCVDAFNLDGGGSRALYYDGAYIANPSRQLPVTLQIFVD